MAKTKIRPGIQDWLNDLEDNILDTLTDEELERLVEWLGRVWGTNQDK